MSWIKNLLKKSANNGGFNTISYGCNYIYPNGNTSPSELIRQNKGYVYACNQKLTQYLSSIPIHLYTSTSSRKSLIIDNKPTPIHQAKHLRKVIKKSLNKDIVEIEAHPVLDLLNKPTDNMSYNSWIAFIQSYISLMGNALVEIVKEGNTIKALEPILWESIDPIINNTNGKISSYRYSPQWGGSKQLLPDNVIHFQNLLPGSTTIGQGNLEACINEAQMVMWANNQQMTLSRNYAIPGVHVNVKSQVSNKEEAEKLARDFMNKFGGQSAGKPIVTFGDGVDVKAIGISPKDMEYQNLRDYAKRVICACWGIPIDLIDTDNSNRASSVTAINSFLRITIYPLLTKILEELNNKVVSTFDESLFIWYDPLEIMEVDQKLQADVINSYVASGVISTQEARVILNYEEE